MSSCSIAFVLSKSIAGISLVKFLHHAVSGDLGYDRGTGNRETRFITSGYPSLRDGTLRQAQPVDKEEAGLLGQLFHRHHLRGDDADAHSYSFPVNQVEEGLTFPGV
jgi:hypothetical protein